MRNPFNFISKLATQGKLEAYKEKRNWVTTKQAVENYIKSIKESLLNSNI
jgi:hypothetical protein